MVWAQARNSASASLAPLVPMSPRCICIGTTQTDVMQLQMRVEAPLCPRGLQQLAVVAAAHTATTCKLIYESASGAPFWQLQHLSSPSVSLH